MFKSNIIDILKSFSKEEMREFGNFVRSPFFNTSQSVVKLFDQLRLFYPEFNDTGLDRKIVYKNIFGKAKYNDGLLRVLISNLTKLAKEYLIFVNSRNNSLNQKLFLLNELNVRKLEKLFPLARKDAENYFKKLPSTDVWYFHDKAFLEDNIYVFNQWSRSRSKKKNNISDDEQLKKIMDNFTRFYLIGCLGMILKVIFINKYGKIKINLPFAGDILEILEARIEEFSDVPVINFHLNEILLLTKGGRKYFETLKEIFINETGQYIYLKIYSLHNILQRYASLQILKGKLSYKKEKLMLYKLAIAKKVLKNPDTYCIDTNNFLSIVNTALELKETGWAELFISENQVLLATEAKDDVKNVSLSNILFKRKEYEQALELLNKVKTKKIELLISVKILLLKIYYELNMFIEAYMVVDTFRHLLPKAEKIYFSPVVYHSHKNFLKYYSTLIKAHEKDQPEKKLEVLNEVKKEFEIAERPWLMEKAQKSI